MATSLIIPPLPAGYQYIEARAGRVNDPGGDYELITYVEGALSEPDMQVLQMTGPIVGASSAGFQADVIAALEWIMEYLVFMAGGTYADT